MVFLLKMYIYVKYDTNIITQMYSNVNICIQYSLINIVKYSGVMKCLLNT